MCAAEEAVGGLHVDGHFVVAGADEGIGLGDEVDKAGIVGARGHLGAEDGGVDASLLKLLAHHHDVYAGLAISDPGQDRTIGIDHTEELGRVAANAVFLVDAHGAIEPEENTGEVEVDAVATIELSGDGAVLIEIGAVSRAAGAHEAAKYGPIEQFVGVDEGWLPTHSLGVEPAVAVELADVVDAWEVGADGREFQDFGRVGSGVTGGGSEEVGDLEDGAPGGEVV